ncbi:hypothetical protein M409DRAFT_55706 [Zasmidium cellare ATCC 36951]|uniref:PWWP domain-containing protein n=1 Tax=Zasmidium cellare ATCC 36951 TaxID=1080233 RepID=A0A6A6CJG4_ZASCE|nr:uncharacterized protein M409DRAFT_55706 [Zasmidium cellare ATCC 36951]KAF2165849.1 hypothetical protein M409DRAFT_55706 [Zasmidium cellare ATCC 36951]
MAGSNFSVEALMNSHHVFHQLGDDIALVSKTPSRPNHPAPVTEGSTWLITYNGALWPAMVCDVDGAPARFIASRRGPHELPAILLGRHKYIWVSTQTIREYDPNRDYLASAKKFDQPEILATDDDSTKVEKQRQKAFRQDAPAFLGAEYWHNYISRNSQVRKLEAERNAQESRKKSQSTPKRRRSDEDSFSSGSRKRRATGEKGHSTESKGYPTPTSSRKKSNRNMFGLEYAHLFGGCHDEGTESPSRKAGSTMYSQVVARAQRARHHDVDIDDDTDVDGSNGLFMPKTGDDKARHQKSPSFIKREQRHAPPQVGPNMCRVLISSNRSGIIIPLTALDNCFYLHQRETFNNITKEHIIDLRKDPRAIDQALTEQQFLSIYDYLHTGKIVPHITPSTNGDSISAIEKTRSAQILSQAFVAATKIQHEYLQEIIQQKLCRLHPLPIVAIPPVAREILSVTSPNGGTKVEKFMREWIIDHVGWDFWDLCPKFSEPIHKLITEHGLAEVVFGKVVQRMEGEKAAADREEAEKTAAAEGLTGPMAPMKIEAATFQAKNIPAGMSAEGQMGSKRTEAEQTQLETMGLLEPENAKLEQIEAENIEAENPALEKTAREMAAAAAEKRAAESLKAQDLATSNAKPSNIDTEMAGTEKVEEPDTAIPEKHEREKMTDLYKTEPETTNIEKIKPDSTMTDGMKAEQQPLSNGNPNEAAEGPVEPLPEAVSDWLHL